MTVNFEPGVIKVEKEKEFAELKGAIVRALGPDRVEKFLKQIRSKGIRVRDLEAALDKRVFEQVDETLATSGATAQQLYQALTMGDQGQMREFYLSQVELVDPALRTRFHKLYQYY